jgi:hypothetical protein
MADASNNNFEKSAYDKASPRQEYDILNASAIFDDASFIHDSPTE